MTLKDRPDLLFATDDSDLVSATPRPLLYYHQLPLRWLNADPGFFILLRAPTQNVLPEWIIPPKDLTNQSPPFYTFSSTKNPNKVKRVLIVTHHQTSQLTWKNFETKFPDADIRWVSYSNTNPLPPWPNEMRLDYRLFCYHPDWVPDVVYDINYWQGDTLSPLHIHALALGAKLEPTNQYDEDLKPRKVFITWYGSWNIY